MNGETGHSFKEDNTSPGSWVVGRNLATHSWLEKNSNRMAGQLQSRARRQQSGMTALLGAYVCVESSCGRGLSENDSREVSCGSFMKCFEYDVKNFDLIL